MGARWRLRERTGQGADGTDGQRSCWSWVWREGRGAGGLRLPPSSVNRPRQEPHALRVSLFLNPSPSPWEIMKKTEQMNTNATCFFEDRET